MTTRKVSNESSLKSLNLNLDLKFSLPNAPTRLEANFDEVLLDTSLIPAAAATMMNGSETNGNKLMTNHNHVDAFGYDNDNENASYINLGAVGESIDQKGVETNRTGKGKKGRVVDLLMTSTSSANVNNLKNSASNQLHKKCHILSILLDILLIYLMLTNFV